MRRETGLFRQIVCRTPQGIRVCKKLLEIEVDLDKSDEVKYICAQRYLEYIEDLNSRIDTVVAIVGKQKERLDVMGISYEQFKSGNTNISTIPDGIARLIELIDEASVNLVEYREQLHVASLAIDMLPSFSMRKVMRAHYITGKTWAQIEQERYYTHSGLMKLRRRAIIQVYDHMPEEWRCILPKAV